MYQMVAFLLSGALALSASACMNQADISVQGREGTVAQETIGQTEGTGMDTVSITVGGQVFTAALRDNETAKAFAEKLPLEVTMVELNGNEKYIYLDESLPTAASNPGRIQRGDIMLYGSSCLVVFYEDFSTSYSYTPIGNIADADGLAAALGKGNVTVAFALGE